VRGWPVGRKLLRLDLLTPSSDRGLVLRVHGVVGGCVAAVDGVVEGAAEGFGCALGEFISRLASI
jgi:hypothetical protein